MAHFKNEIKNHQVSWPELSNWLSFYSEGQFYEMKLGSGHLIPLQTIKETAEEEDEMACFKTKIENHKVSWPELSNWLSFYSEGQFYEMKLGSGHLIPLQTIEEIDVHSNSDDVYKAEEIAVHSISDDVFKTEEIAVYNISDDVFKTEEIAVYSISDDVFKTEDIVVRSHSDDVFKTEETAVYSISDDVFKTEDIVVRSHSDDVFKTEETAVHIISDDVFKTEDIVVHSNSDDVLKTEDTAVRQSSQSFVEETDSGETCHEESSMVVGEILQESENKPKINCFVRAYKSFKCKCLNFSRQVRKLNCCK